MKRLLLPSILFLLAIANGFSQNAPKMFNYQAVARDATGAFLAGKTVSVRITITDLSNISYTETHENISTNKFGLFSIKIGEKSSSTNNISKIKWADGNTNIKVEVDPGTGYAPIGSAQLLSVPYALYADNAGSVSNAGTNAKNILGGKGITIDSSNTRTLIINSTVSTLDSSKYIRLETKPSASGNYILVWDGQNWTTQTITSTGSTQSNGKSGISVNGNTIVANPDGITIDTTGGKLKLKDGKIQNDVLQWTGKAWEPTQLTIGTGSVKSVGVDAPLMDNGSNGVVQIRIEPATDQTDGYLTKENWITFNEKIGIATPQEGDIIYYSGGSWKQLSFPQLKDSSLTIKNGISGPVWALDRVGAIGSRISSINGQSAGIQTIKLDTTAENFIISYNSIVPGTTNQLLGLPILGKATTTSKAGLLSKADYDKFSSGNTQKITVGAGLTINPQNKVTLKLAPSLDTLNGLLRVRSIRPNIDSLNIGTPVENQILKVKNGKLTFVADTAYLKSTVGKTYTSQSLDIGADTIGLKPGITPGDVMTWDGNAWVAKGGGVTNCQNLATLSQGVTSCSTGSMTLSPANNLSGQIVQNSKIFIEYQGQSYSLNVNCPSQVNLPNIGVSFESTSITFTGTVKVCVTAPLPSGVQATYAAGVGIEITSNTIAAKNKQALWNAGSIGYKLVDTTSFKNLNTTDKNKVLKWDGTQWTADTILRGSSTGTGWSLTGNTLTTAGVNYIGTNDAVGFKIKTDNVTKMTIDATGNVLFGKLSTDSLTTPRAAFEQRGHLNGVSAIFGGEGAGVSLSSAAIGFNQYYAGAAKSIGKGFSGYISLDYLNKGDITFGTTDLTIANSANQPANSSSKVIITKSGNVGIGASFVNPLSKLHVMGFMRSDSLVGTDSSFIGVGPNGMIVRRKLINSSNAWNLTGNDKTDSTKNYIGCSDPAPLIFKTSGNEQMRITRSGNVNINKNLTVNGLLKTQNVTEKSDIRYKMDIHQIKNALDKVKKLMGVSYNWRRTEFPDHNFEKGTDLGLIAQEVEKVLPELVNTDDQGFKSVEYSHLVSVLVEAIKEQQIQIESLKIEVASKETKVQNNESRIQTLETSVQSMATQMQLLLELVGKNEGLKASK